MGKNDETKMKLNSKLIPKSGDVRIKKRFLFFPKTLPLYEGSKILETRIFEIANIKQSYLSIEGYGLSYNINYNIWLDISWT